MTRNTGLSRREILQGAATLAAGLGLAQQDTEALAAGMSRIASQQQRVLWLQGMSCSGCSVSFLNAEAPGPLSVLTRMISLVYHQTVSAAQGHLTQELIDKLVEEGDYLVVLEGSVPLGMPEACCLGGIPITEVLVPVLTKAKGIVAVGTCAAFGGIPAAEGNPTTAGSVQAFMKQKRIPTEGRLVNCPGCPVHPQSLVGTLAYIAGKGYPPVDKKLLTPKLFYGHSVHDECPRFHYWQKQDFAEKFGDDGCLFKLGCLGPLTSTSCPRRQWNGGVNWCIRASAPCIGCSSEQFALKRDFPFYRKGELDRESKT